MFLTGSLLGQVVQSEPEGNGVVRRQYIIQRPSDPTLRQTHSEADFVSAAIPSQGRNLIDPWPEEPLATNVAIASGARPKPGVRTFVIPSAIPAT